jgi:hypothetical protein
LSSAITTLPGRFIAEAIRADAASTTITLSPQDTFLSLNATNYSAQPVLTYTWPDHRVANAILMKLDLAGVPANAVVETARLHLILLDNDGAADDLYTMTVRKIVDKNPRGPRIRFQLLGFSRSVPGGY